MLAVDPSSRYSMSDVSTALSSMIQGLSATMKERSADALVGAVRDVGVGMSQVTKEVKMQGKRVDAVGVQVQQGQHQIKKFSSDMQECGGQCKEAAISRAEVQSLHARNVDLQRDLDALRSDLSARRPADAEIARLKSEVDRLNSELATLRPGGTSAKVAPASDTKDLDQHAKKKDGGCVIC